MAIKYVTIIGLVWLLLSGCSTGRKAGGVADNDRSEREAVSLSEHLRRIPGLTVKGSGSNIRVYTRGLNSINSGTQPIFVIDHQIMGTDYGRVVSALDTGDINSVELLTGSDASLRYGSRASNGVILIKTRN